MTNSLNQDSKQIRVLQLLPEMNTGGVERGVYDLSKYISENPNFEADNTRAYQISNYIACDGGNLADDLEKNYSVNILRGNFKSKNPLKIFGNSIKLSKYIRDNEIDIIHARSRAPAWSGYIAAKLNDAHYITTFHGFYNFSFFLKKLYNRIMCMGEVVIAGSKFMQDHIMQNYAVNANKIEVIYRGIDIDEFTPEAINQEEVDSFKSSLLFSDSKLPLIVLTGRVTEWKGHLIALKAIRELIFEHNSKVNLAIVGNFKTEDNYYQRLQSYIEQNNLQGNIFFYGNLAKPQIAYKAADLVINCSTKPETFGRVIAEAGAMGKFVIASNIGGAKEIIKPASKNKYKNDFTGDLFRNTNHKDLATKIIDFLQSKSKNFLPQNAINHINEKFSLSKMLKSKLELYASVVEGRNFKK